MCTDPLDVLGLRYGLFLLVQDNVLTCYANEVWYYDMSTCDACMFQPFMVSTAGSIDLGSVVDMTCIKMRKQFFIFFVIKIKIDNIPKILCIHI